MIVYNNNPVAVCPESSKVIAGFTREDLFCVVMDSFLTDTADYADIVLPATTQLEHTDIHKSYGHLYVLANNAAIAPVGESLPNAEVFRRLAARMGFEEECFRDRDDDLARQAIGSGHANLAGIDWETLKTRRLAAARAADDVRALREGQFPHALGQVRVLQRVAEGAGHRSAAVLQPARRAALQQPALARKYPLNFLSPPVRNFLNSSFANLKRFRDAEGEPSLELHSADAARARHRATATRCACSTTAAASR